MKAGDTIGRLTIVSIEDGWATCKCTCGSPVRRKIVNLMTARSALADSSCKRCRVKKARAKGRGSHGRLMG